MLAGDGSAVLSDLREALARRAHDYDRSGDWPAESLAAAIAAGCWRWVIPREFGGEGLTALDILLRYEAVASGCLTTALILTQRDAAADLIAGGENAALKHELLPALARGTRMSTVGIAQLTTSKRGPGPAVRARTDGDGFVIV
jgi:alkylation response protein AidB-like acyl-CoA dehydrogenase